MSTGVIIPIYYFINSVWVVVAPYSHRQLELSYFIVLAKIASDMIIGHSCVFFLNYLLMSFVHFYIGVFVYFLTYIFWRLILFQLNVLQIYLTGLWLIFLLYDILQWKIILNFNVKLFRYLSNNFLYGIWVFYIKTFPILWSEVILLYWF